MVGFIDYYNKERLHSSIGYIATKDRLEGRAEMIFKDRDRKLEAARELGKIKLGKKNINFLHTMA